MPGDQGGLTVYSRCIGRFYESTSEFNFRRFAIPSSTCPSPFMSATYYVRCGPMGEMLRATGRQGLIRRSEVVVRTTRGVEIGQIVRQTTSQNDMTSTIMRPVRDEDRWLLKQLQKRCKEAIRQCQKALEEADFDGALLDIDQQFDGGTLILHFIGSDELGHQITRPIVERYESVVRSEKLATRLLEGCGPNCGTDESQCKGSCSGCAVAGVCSPTSRADA